MARKHEIPVIPSEFITYLPQAKNKPFITANGLIYLAHLQGLKRVDVHLVHEPTKDDPSAIVRCEVETDLGVFSDYGEVSPRNQGSVGGTYPLSMATTRARNRALRIATGCPLTSYEEIGMEGMSGADEHEVQSQQQQRAVVQARHDVDERTGEVRASVDERTGEVRASMEERLARVYATLREMKKRLEETYNHKVDLPVAMSLAEAHAKREEWTAKGLELKEWKASLDADADDLDERFPALTPVGLAGELDDENPF